MSQTRLEKNIPFKNELMKICISFINKGYSLLSLVKVYKLCAEFNSTRVTNYVDKNIEKQWNFVGYSF